MNTRKINTLVLVTIIFAATFSPFCLGRRGSGGQRVSGGMHGGSASRGGFRRGGFDSRWRYQRPYWGSSWWGLPYWKHYGYYGYPYRRYYDDCYDCNGYYPHRYQYNYPYWWGSKRPWPPKQILEVPEDQKAVDDKGLGYWEVFNATDLKLTFYSNDGTRSTLEPGERAKIMRGKSFGYAVASKSGKLLNDNATRKHFITIFQRGYAADHTNKRKKWESWGEVKEEKSKKATRAVQTTLIAQLL